MSVTFEGIQLQHYQIQRLLARGGMSMVYLATDDDEQSRREVAIKIVHRSQVDDSERFQREVEIVRTLTHEHILPILDNGTYDDDWYYMVMPYMEQGTLLERIKRQPLTPEEAEFVLEQVANAIQFAHDKGIIHRDIKPTNVLLRTDRFVYLTDFGIAKTLDDEKSLTGTGAMIGTPKYMAPELAFEPATTLSDVYSLGVLLYQMLTGRVPFEGTTPLQTLQKHIQEQPLPPSLLNPSIPHSVEYVILCALNKDPQLRFQTPGEMAQAYKAALKAPVIASPPAQVVVHRIPRHKHSPLVQIAALVALVLLFGAMLTIPFVNQGKHAALGAAPRSQATLVVQSHFNVPPPPQAQPTTHPTAPPVQQNNAVYASNISNAPSTSSHGNNHKHGHKHGHKN